MDNSFWRLGGEWLREAKEDAVRLAVYEQEVAGLDFVTDGEAQRAAYDRHFLGGLAGIDAENFVPANGPAKLEGSGRDETGNEEYSELSRLKPQVISEIAFKNAVGVEERKFLQQTTRKKNKATLCGPISLWAQLVDKHYGDDDDLIMALAAALNKEMLQLDAQNPDMLSIDEPGFHFCMDAVRRVGKKAIGRMVEGVKTPVFLHVCYGYALVYRNKSHSPLYAELLEMVSDYPIAGVSIEYAQPNHQPDLLKYAGDKIVALGLLDMSSNDVEGVNQIAGRLREALEVIAPEKLHASSDCGMWYLPRDVAFGKISALAAAARMVRAEVE